MAFIPDDDMVSTFSSNTTIESFDIGIRVHRRLQSIGLIRQKLFGSLIHSILTQGASLA
jgi:hypothetical protein